MVKDLFKSKWIEYYNYILLRESFGPVCQLYPHLLINPSSWSPDAKGKIYICLISCLSAHHLVQYQQ